MMKNQRSILAWQFFLVALTMKLTSGREFESAGIEPNNRINITSSIQKAFWFNSPVTLDLLLLEVESLAEFQVPPKILISRSQEGLDGLNVMTCSFEYSFSCVLNQWGPVHTNDIIYFALYEENDRNSEKSSLLQSALFGKLTTRESMEIYLGQQFLADSAKEIIVPLEKDLQAIQLDIEKQGIYQLQVTLLEPNGSLFSGEGYEIALSIGSLSIEKAIINQGYILDNSIWFSEFNSTELNKMKEAIVGAEDQKLSNFSVTLSSKNANNAVSNQRVAVIAYKYVDCGIATEDKGLIVAQIGQQQGIILSHNQGIVLLHPMLQMSSSLNPVILSFNIKGIESQLLLSHNLLVSVYSSVERLRQNKVENVISNQLSFNLTLTRQPFSSIVLALNLKSVASGGQPNSKEDDKDNQELQQLALLQTKIYFAAETTNNQVDNNTANQDKDKQKKKSNTLGEEALLPIVLVGGIIVIIIFSIIYIKCVQGRNSINEPAKLDEEEENEEEQNNQDQNQQQPEQDMEAGKVVLKKKPISTKNSTKANGQHIELAQDDKSAIEIIENQDTTDRKYRARNKNSKRKNSVRKENPPTQNDATSHSNDNSHLNLKSNDSTNLLEHHPHGKRIPMRAKNMKSHLRIVIEDSSFDNVKQPSQQQLQQLQLQQQRQQQLQQQQKAIQKQMQMKALRQKQLQASNSSQETN